MEKEKKGERKKERRKDTYKLTNKVTCKKCRPQVPENCEITLQYKYKEMYGI
jgi:hypothetical protein